MDTQRQRNEVASIRAAETRPKNALWDNELISYGRPAHAKREPPFRDLLNIIPLEPLSTMPLKGTLLDNSVDSRVSGQS